MTRHIFIRLTAAFATQPQRSYQHTAKKFQPRPHFSRQKMSRAQSLSHGEAGCKCKYTYSRASIDVDWAAGRGRGSRFAAAGRSKK